MADLTRLLARPLPGRGACASNHGTVGLGHPISITVPTGAHATSMRPTWPVWGVTGLFCLGLLTAMSSGAWARQSHQHTQAVVALTALPRQAQDVHQRILAGGPFRYEKDGTVFGNRERLLPRQPRGFYREYTVPTPGERDRGARRIVCGGKEVRQPETCFYTRDHYASFQTIDPRH